MTTHTVPLSYKVTGTTNLLVASLFEELIKSVNFLLYKTVYGVFALKEKQDKK